MEAWKLQHLEVATVERQHVEGEKKMQSLYYTMEGHRFDFKKYTTLHRSCHDQINAANKAMVPPMPPLLECIKVQHFLAGIKSSPFTAPVATVKETPTNINSELSSCRIAASQETNQLLKSMVVAK